VKVTFPNGRTLNLSKPSPFENTPVKRAESFGIDGATFPLTTWTWTQPVAGTWNAVITCGAKLSQNSIKAALILYNESPVKVFSHLNSYDLQLGQEVGVVANLYDSRFAMNIDGRPAPLLFEQGTLTAVMDVTFPDGKEYVVKMHDDGLHSDLLANDGVYGAVLQAFEAGQYTAQAVFSGVTQSGEKFLRTTDHLFNVVEPSITLTGLATAENDVTRGLFFFHVDVDVLHDQPKDEELTVKAYAEVWGTDRSGLEYIPVAWVQAMVTPERQPSGRKVITLQLNEQWLHKAQANYPLQLRNVWLEDREFSVPFSRRDRVFVEHKTNKMASLFRPNLKKKDLPITREMREGPMPLVLRNATAAGANPKLLLVHGYCAGANEFPPSQFTNAVQFADFKKSRTNDAFALRLKEFAEQQGITSFGIVGHSQAGLASVHLHTYYFSGLEVAAQSTGRLIQSVGSPYGGTGLAGSLASVGGIFGVGCGSNSDLTRDGARLWSASIPPEITKDLDYYTTIYGSKDYCAWGANMVLDKPNDGTTETKWANIKGGVNKGSKKDWCHTTGMTYAGQCGDAARNAIMNTNAAR